MFPRNSIYIGALVHHNGGALWEIDEIKGRKVKIVLKQYGKVIDEKLVNKSEDEIWPYGY